jgi:hypothetical protein
MEYLDSGYYCFVEGRGSGALKLMLLSKQYTPYILNSIIGLDEILCPFS